MTVKQAPGSVPTDAARDPTVKELGRAEQQLAAAEQRVREAEGEYRALVEQAVEGVFRTSPDGRFLMANQALASILGYDTPEQLVAERTDIATQHYVHPDERARFKRLLEAQGVVRDFEYEAYRRDGTTIWLRDHVRAVRDDAGVALYYEGTVEDATHHRRAREVLDLRALQQAAVARLGQGALASNDLSALFDCATSLVADTLAVQCVQVLERRATGDLVLRAGMGWAPSEIDALAVPGGRQSQAGFTVSTARPVVVDDFARELRFHPPSHLLGRGAVSGMSVVIGTPDRPYGVLAAHTIHRRVFTPDDVNFLQAVASLLAAAVARRRAEDVRQHLLARAISAQEEERQRVARELHDETGQALSTILVGLRNLQDAPTLPEARRAADRLRQLTAQTIRDVSRLARGLRPSILDDLGLLPALRRHAEELSAARRLDVHITDDGIDRLTPQVETTLYRIVQEALANVARHAQARSAAVSIERHNGSVRAIIRDDGQGFDVAAAMDAAARRQALGLMGMKERAALLSGAVSITSRPGAGTTVTVTLPIG